MVCRSICISALPLMVYLRSEISFGSYPATPGLSHGYGVHGFRSGCDRGRSVSAFFLGGAFFAFFADALALLAVAVFSFPVAAADPFLPDVPDLRAFVFVFSSVVLASEICARRPARARALSYPAGKAAPDPVVRPGADASAAAAVDVAASTGASRASSEEDARTTATTRRAPRPAKPRDARPDADALLRPPANGPAATAGDGAPATATRIMPSPSCRIRSNPSAERASLFL
mmetsp:Transcript_12213/g.47473  ORF Transcript_12213/g.47473 Transcript_12213/m.47473 type:complete len:232 (+) Transcript_12213:1214-1909(+)